HGLIELLAERPVVLWFPALSEILAGEHGVEDHWRRGGRLGESAVHFRQSAGESLGVGGRGDVEVLGGQHLEDDRSDRTVAVNTAPALQKAHDPKEHRALLLAPARVAEWCALPPTLLAAQREVD